MDSQQEDDDGSYPEDILLSLTGVRADSSGGSGRETGGSLQPRLEEFIAGALGLETARISIVDLEEVSASESTVMFAVFPEESASGTTPVIVTADKLARQLNAFIEKNNDEADCAIQEWFYTSNSTNIKASTHTIAHCTVVEMEEEVTIEEEEAFQLWHDMPVESRTSHLAMVPSPDGVMIQPSHDATTNDSNNDGGSVIEAQLRRDPFLLELDNVPRIDISQVGDMSCTKPFIITGCIPIPDLLAPTTTSENSTKSNTCLPLLTRAQLNKKFGAVEVRTGNRYTLVENGFDNSIPMELGKVIGSDADGNTQNNIVFSPVKELPELFQQDLESILAAFPSFPCTDQQQQEIAAIAKQKYTLCIAGKAGFGIGFHKHNAALFMLLAGQKKWYMASSLELDQQSDEPTHPGFYTSKSSHKCIQKPGEVLYVPDQWYHEIFNLEYTAGIQALPE